MTADAARQLFAAARQPFPDAAPPPPLPAAPSPWERKEEKAMHAVFREWLNLHGLEFCHGRMNKATDLPVGHPDFVVYGPSAVTLFVEFKTESGRLSQDQKDYISRLNKLGFEVLVARTTTDAIEFVKQTLSWI